jgi:hypothetical protein
LAVYECFILERERGRKGEVRQEGGGEAERER